MQKSDKIYIAGHRGMVGSAIYRKLNNKGYYNLVVRNHSELELTDKQKVERFFSEEKINYVFLAAALVGGISDNINYPYDQLLTNILIESNIISAANQYDIKKLLFIGSNCVYPEKADLPLREEALFSGKLDPHWEGYGLAKIVGAKLCQFSGVQFGRNFISVMPCNLYGVNDCYIPGKSRVVASMMRRFHEAKEINTSKVEVWGTGEPLREFLFADDLAEGCIFLMEHDTENEIINIGPGKEYSIREIAEAIKEVVGYRGDIVFNKEKPDGIYRKPVDITKITNYGWSAQTKFETGLKIMYSDFKRKWDLGEIL